MTQAQAPFQPGETVVCVREDEDKGKTVAPGDLLVVVRSDEVAFEDTDGSYWFVRRFRRLTPADDQPAPQSIVKPLQWREIATVGGQYPEQWDATGPGWCWTIQHDKESEYPWTVRPFKTLQSNYFTLEEAKKAVEETHEKLLLSLLSYQPAPDWQRRALDAEARLAEVERGQEWQPIETAPRRGRYLVGSFPKGLVAVCGITGINRGAFTTMDDRYHEPTHWMPLPPPPVQPEPGA